MVFDITAGQVFRCSMVKLGEQVGRHLAERIDPHVEAAAVRHADHDFLHADFAAALDQLVHAGNKAFAKLYPISSCWQSFYPSRSLHPLQIKDLPVSSGHTTYW